MYEVDNTILMQQNLRQFQRALDSICDPQSELYI